MAISTRVLTFRVHPKVAILERQIEHEDIVVPHSHGAAIPAAVGQSITGRERDEAVQQQHNAGVAALTWAKQFYGAPEIYLRSVELRQGPIPYYLAKFDGDLSGSRQVFFAIVLTSGSVLEPVEMLQGTSK